MGIVQVCKDVVDVINEEEKTGGYSTVFSYNTGTKIKLILENDRDSAIFIVILLLMIVLGVTYQMGYSVGEFIFNITH